MQQLQLAVETQIQGLNNSFRRNASAHKVFTMVQDGITTELRGADWAYDICTNCYFAIPSGILFLNAKDFRPLTMLLTKPDKPSQRSYNDTHCSHEWRDIVTIRTEFVFVLIRVSILCQYRDSVTPAYRGKYKVLIM